MASRYFPFSQEFNSDPEGWELTDKFGDRAIRTWTEILAILDRQKNHWKLVDGWDSVIGRKVRQAPASVKKEILWMLSKGWLEVGQWSADPPPDLGQWLANGWPEVGQVLARPRPEVLRAPKYGKYRKSPSGATPPPNLTEPNLTEPKEEKKAQAPITLPDWLPKNEWEEFTENRKRKRAKMTDKIAARIIGVLDELRQAGHEPAGVLNKAVDRNWTSIEFDWIEKNGGQNGNQQFAEPKGFAGIRELQRRIAGKNKSH